MPDLVLSRYRIDRLLGHGGMGEVYAATDLRLDRRVALKFCLPSSASENARRQIEREARAASRLHHANIATIFDYEEDEAGRPFIVMELVEGQSLSKRLQSGPIHPADSLRIARDIAAALEEAHREGFLHRDIKPSNICLTLRGVAKVLDFGLARRNHPETPPNPDDTLTTSVHGTPAYMSPEQAQGNSLDARSDLFSLGAVLYECLTGERAFGASSHTGSLLRVVRDDPPLPSTKVDGIPLEVDILVQRLLDKAPARRPRDAAEVRQHIDALLGTPGSTQHISPTFRRRRLPSLRRWLMPALALAVIAICLGAWRTWQNLERATLPAVARQWYEDGVRALRDGTFWRASKLLEAAVEAAPRFAPARARLAEAWLELDDVQRARQQILLAAPAGSSLDNLSRADRLLVSAIHRAVAGQNEDAISDYRQLLDAVDPSARGAASFDLGRALERAQRRQDAVSSYKEALRLDPSLAAAHLRLARAYSRDSNFAEAGKSLSAAESLYRTSNNLEGVTEVLYQRAQTAVRREQIPEASSFIAQVLELSKATGNIQQSVAALLQRVSIEIAQGSPAEAERTAQAAVDLARKSGAAILATRALIDLGTTFIARRQFQQAGVYLTDALNSARLNSDARSEARAQANLGSLHQLDGKPREALAALEPALDYYSKNSMRIEAGQVRLMVARTRRQTGDYDGARDAFQTLLAEARVAANKNQMALAEEGLASVARQRERYREALDHFQSAANLFAPKNLMGVVFATHGMSDAAASLGLLSDAERYAREALRLSADARNPTLAFASFLSLAQVQTATARRDDAQRAIQDARRSLAAPASPDQEKSLAAAKARLEATSGRKTAASACAASPDAAPASPAAVTTQFDCALDLYLSGNRPRAAELLRPLLPSLELLQRLESLWFARAIISAAAPHEAALRASARQSLSAFEQTLSPQDLAAYRKLPLVVRLQKSIL